MGLLKSVVCCSLRVLVRILHFYLPIYYRLKVEFYRLFNNSEAAAYVLYESIRPDIVLRMYGAQIGNNVRINRWLTLHESNNCFSNLSIGDDVHIGKHVFIDLSGKVEICNRVSIAMFSRILTHQNFGDSQLAEDYPATKGNLTIPDNVVLGSGATILFPTELVEGTIIGAGAVVKGKYNKQLVLVGNPAQKTLRLHRKM